MKPSNPNIKRLDPGFRRRTASQRSTLANRSSRAQGRRLPGHIMSHVSGAMPYIPTFQADVTLSELRARSATVSLGAQELAKAYPTLKEMETFAEQNPRRVITHSMRIVDRDGKPLFIYGGERYRDDGKKGVVCSVIYRHGFCSAAP